MGTETQQKYSQEKCLICLLAYKTTRWLIVNWLHWSTTRFGFFHRKIGLTDKRQIQTLLKLIYFMFYRLEKNVIYKD